MAFSKVSETANFHGASCAVAKVAGRPRTSNFTTVRHPSPPLASVTGRRLTLDHWRQP